MSEGLYAVVMAGGPGKRFWPASTHNCPKPFLRLFGQESLIQSCYRRLRSFLPPENIFVIVGKAHLGLVAEHLPELPEANRVGEACPRDSAACIGLATALVRCRDPGGAMVVVPADQFISPVEEYVRTVKALHKAASEQNCVATIGISPADPAVRFGYIEAGEVAGEFGGLSVHRVASFKEKPSPEAARAYVSSGKHLWNAGIFIAPASVMAEAIKRHFKPLGAVLGAMEAQLSQGADPIDVTGRYYESIPKTSIDYAVMERLERVLTVKASFRWDDVGDWRALRRYLQPDSEGNVVTGNHVGVRSCGNIIYAKDLFVGTLGLENVVIAHVGNSLLVANADAVDSLKDLVGEVEQKRGRQP